MENNLLYEKVYGCLLGGIIGDAMGAPVEDFHYKQIQKEYGEISEFDGNGTDDSAIKSILCEAIIANNGYITADEFAEAFMNHKEFYDIYFIPVRNMYHKVKDGLVLPVYAGIGNMQSSSSAMAISPMGLINACNPRQAALETYDVAGLIHAGDTTFCRDAACAMSAAVAEAMNPYSTVEAVIEASTLYLHKKSSVVMTKRIKETIELAKETGDYEAFREKYYNEYLYDVPCDSRETVPCSLALFYLAGGDPVKSIIYSANFGRDADTIGTMTGALSGAFKGVNSLKADWVEKVEKDNLVQKDLAQKIIDIIKGRLCDSEKSINLVRVLG